MIWVTPDGETSGYCPLAQCAAELVGRRWTASVISVLLSAAHLRFREIRAHIPGLSDRLLADRLTELADEGIVEQCDGGYRLTEKGRALAPLIAEIGKWAHTWVGPDVGERPGRKRPPHAGSPGTC